MCEQGKIFEKYVNGEVNRISCTIDVFYVYYDYVSDL